VFGKRKTPERKADLLEERLTAAVPEVAALILDQLEKRLNIHLDGPKKLEVLFELFAYFMHILDRMAFQALGVAGSGAFGDRLVSKVASSLATADAVNQLRETYNMRQVQYATYRAFIAPEGEPPKETLVWEFSKVLLGLTGDSNPVTLNLIFGMVCDWTPVVIQEALKVDEVLNS